MSETMPKQMRTQQPNQRNKASLIQLPFSKTSNPALERRSEKEKARKKALTKQRAAMR
jgi:hypothetical protein